MPRIQDSGHCFYSNEPFGYNGYYLELPPFIHFQELQILHDNPVLTFYRLPHRLRTTRI